jgi:hypothetical protein
MRGGYPIKLIFAGLIPESKRRRRLKSRMLSAELIHRVGRLVRPRHYWKLICCCKLFKKALDIDEYWIRLAVFMHARYSIV